MKKIQLNNKTILAILAIQVIIACLLIILLIAPLLGFNFDLADNLMVLGLTVTGVSMAAALYLCVIEKFFLKKKKNQ